jgi:hypothetical protein
MDLYLVKRIFFPDGGHGIFIEKEKSDNSGDLIRHITQNGTKQVSIEKGIKLKEFDPGFYSSLIGDVDEMDAEEVLELAQNDPKVSQLEFREWTDAFIQKLKTEKLLGELPPNAGLPPGWCSS